MASTSFREVTTEATLEEKKKLRKEFRVFDMIFITIAAIIGIDTLGAVSSNGGQALTWLVISAITFLIPYGLLTAELGTTFTQEGGVYEWCKMAGGRYFASLAAMLYWISNPLWVGGTLSVTAIAAIATFFFGNANYQIGGSATTNAIFRIIVALIFIWGVTWSAILSLRVGKWLSVFGSYAKFALFAVFAVLAIVFLAGGHSTGDHLTFADLIPSANWYAILSAVIPVLIFQWVGFELQNGAGEEMVNPQRDVPHAIIRAGIVAVVAYAIPITVILFTLPKSQLTNVGSFLAAYKTVAAILPSFLATGLGWLVALAIVLSLASSGGSWIIGADRTYAIASLDRTGPAFLGRFSGRYGTPIVVNTMSGIVASIAMIAAILITAFGSGNITTLFGLVFGFVVSTTTLSYLFIFPAFFLLRLRYPDVHRPYKVPGGIIGAAIVTLLPFIYAAFASYFILIPTDATVANNGVTRLTYELTQFVPLAIIVLLTTVFYIWGHLEKRNKDVVVEVNLADQGLEGLSGVAGD
ncbi:MAG TPA: APC family permease [Ktedonobacteraceae bacterium]|jgi:amino acid transporter|nr:APC family permease [Ktedonobacteraceae bacterium]